MRTRPAGCLTPVCQNKQLDKWLARIAIALFSGASLIFALLCYNVASNFSSLAEVINYAFASGDSTLGWLGFVAADARIGIGLRGLAVLMVFAYIASIVFFVVQRQQVRPDTKQ